MTNENETMNCAFWCWGLAAVAAVLTVILCLVIGDMGIIASLFFGIVVCVVLGALMGWIFCRPLPPLGSDRSDDASDDSAEPLDTADQNTAHSLVDAGPEAVATPAPTSAQPQSSGDTSAASQPAGLSAARDGGADDLKRIKGVGPKLEELLNSLGFFHFDQIANWSVAEIAWVDENLKGFKGRVTRDDWVAQAKTLAAGGNTEFSKRVDDGDVY